MLMVTRYSGRCSHCSGRPLQHATLLVGTGRGNPNPLRLNLGGTLREDIKRILRTQREVRSRWQTRVQEHAGQRSKEGDDGVLGSRHRVHLSFPYSLL